MEVFQREKATFLRLFWLPLALLLLTLFPWWGAWAYAVALVGIVIVCFLSGGLLLWGVCLIVLGIRLRADIRFLLLGAGVSAIPLVWYLTLVFL
jgi:hypothetical protein